MTQTEALKPCPFCGGEAELIIDNDHHGEFFQLGCKDKKCLGHWAYYTESIAETPVSEAIAHWNTRALAQQSNEQVEPVAWIEHHKGGDNLNWEEVNHPYAKATPLYTTPPQRKPLTEWQPIETAPKNSTSILIYCPRSERKPVCEAWWAIAYEGDHGGHWQTPIGPNGRGYTILETAPTHWMPLPRPPIEAAHGIKE